MVRVGCVVAAVALAAAVLSLDSLLADAAAQGRDETRFLLFSGADVWRQGAFLHGGTLWAPDGVAADGIVVKLMTVKGFYRYRAEGLGNATVIGGMLAGSLTPGFHFVRGPLSATVFLGPEFQAHWLSPYDAGNPARGSHIGLRVAADFWWQLSPRAMVTGDATFTTIASAYAARIAYGWRVFDGIYLGPEAQLYGAENYLQLRAGAHLTGIRYKSFECQGAIGYAVDDDDDEGVYLRLGLLSRL